jgi:hypothetical protein
MSARTTTTIAAVEEKEYQTTHMAAYRRLRLATPMNMSGVVAPFAAAAASVDGDVVAGCSAHDKTRRVTSLYRTLPHTPKYEESHTYI